MASTKVFTPTTSSGESGMREIAFKFPWGTTACLKPKRAASAKTQPGKKGKKTSSTLSAWLQNQQNGGRNT